MNNNLTPQETNYNLEYLQSGITKPSPQSYAIYWCMMATGISRIFNNENLQEFAFRLALLLDSMKLIENWFAHDKLINFKYKDLVYTLTLNDIINHFGIEAIDRIEHMKTRESFVSDIPEAISRTQIIGLFTGFNLLPIEDSKNKAINLKENARKISPDISEQKMKNADFFAKDFMKAVPSGCFNSKHEKILAKEAELELRKKKVEAIPEFDIKKVPLELINQCGEIMYGKEHLYKLEDYDNKEDFYEDVRPMIYFAWLCANDLFIIDSDFSYSGEVEGVDFNIDDYEINDEYGGSNINITYEDYDIESCIPILKGLFFNHD